ncbi:MAG: Re/Si-specific NAD(P)(+) transhydrogenase subunit alpha [Leptonema sp. (in: bacteria)]
MINQIPKKEHTLIISVPKEIHAGEKRVAIVPETVAKFKKLGYEIYIEKDAGKEAGFSNENYQNAGATIIEDIKKLYEDSDIFIKVNVPSIHPITNKNELEMLKESSFFIGFFFPLNNKELVLLSQKNKINVISMDSIPRITKAQKMDVLSSQTNLAGYRAVILAANYSKKVFPLMMTAAGTISPAKVVILGAGVAGLQAIATAKRLGAVVEVSDVRKEVKEQVQSLGAKYIEPPDTVEEEGGYAKEVSKDFLQKQQEILKKHLSNADIVITTAQVPGKKAPLLILEDMIKSMQPGSVIVDMAAATGGNCELTEPDQIVEKYGVKIIGFTNLVSDLCYDASQLYSRNIQALIEYLTKENKLSINLEDEILKGSLITYKGEIIHQKTKELFQ